MPTDWPVEKFAHPAVPVILEMTGKRINGAKADRMGAPLKPAILRKMRLICLEYMVVADVLPSGQR
jgi:hypothetical protein